MTRMSRAAILSILAGLVFAGAARAEILTADRAVELALQHNTDVIGADAGVVDARAGWYSSLSGVLPRVSGSLSRSGYQAKNQVSGSATVNPQTGLLIPPGSTDVESFRTSPSLSGSWSILNLSSLVGVSSARNGVKAAAFSRTATRQQVALLARRQFYEVVKAVQLARVADEALILARDDARRVQALFDVGSVSKSDVLSAEVRSAQGELDSLAAAHQVTIQRITLADLIGVAERQMGAVDTVLSVEPRAFDESQLLAEATANRPDLHAAEAQLRSANASLLAAKFARLPYLSVSGSATFNPRSSSKTTFFGTDSLGTPLPAVEFSNRDEIDRQMSGTIAINLDIFDGFGMESRIASARAQTLRARERRDALQRNLESEVHQALLTYREALQRYRVAQRAIDSAVENMKLTQQKYNVGSATILELIDAQVQLQRAQSDRVSALADIRVAEADIDRVRGSGD